MPNDFGNLDFNQRRKFFTTVFTSTRYHRNQKIHEGIEFRCDICGKDFVFKRGLQRHIGNVHTHSLLLRSDLTCLLISTNEGNSFLRSIVPG